MEQANEASVDSKAASPARPGIIAAAFPGGETDREPFLFFLLFLSQRNLISQASLVRGVGFAASIRTSSTRREANPWASENHSLSARGGGQGMARLCLPAGEPHVQ